MSHVTPIVNLELTPMITILKGDMVMTISNYGHKDIKIAKKFTKVS